MANILIVEDDEVRPHAGRARARNGRARRRRRRGWRARLCQDRRGARPLRPGRVGHPHARAWTASRWRRRRPSASPACASCWSPAMPTSASARPNSTASSSTCVQKPFTLAEIRERVARALGLKSPRLLTSRLIRASRGMTSASAATARNDAASRSERALPAAGRRAGAPDPRAAHFGGRGRHRLSRPHRGGERRGQRHRLAARARRYSGRGREPPTPGSPTASSPGRCSACRSRSRIWR